MSVLSETNKLSLQAIAFQSNRNSGVEDDSVANSSLAESLPTEEFTPKINQIVSNVLLVRLEKEKIKFVK